MDKKQFKEYIKTTFNTVSSGYDHHTMRFFAENAIRISSYLHLSGNEHVLDVGTGTGYAAIAVAQKLPKGQVTGIDISTNMLAQAKKKQKEAGIQNIIFKEMDMESIEFPEDYFDAAISTFSIFFSTDINKLLIHISTKIKTGGKILITTFYKNAFSPLLDLYMSRLKKYGVEVPILAWKRIATKKNCTSLLNQAGLHSIQCDQIECGYYLDTPADWWYIIRNAGLRRYIDQLSPNDFDRFKKEHIAEVAALASDKGIWLEMNIIYTLGIKKA